MKTKYQIVEFEDGTFAVRRSYFFGIFTDFLSKNTNLTWDTPTKIHCYCKCYTLEEAKDVLTRAFHQEFNVTIKVKKVHI